jgi:hypothetical protein
MTGVVTAINAQLPRGGEAGGIEQFVTGLVHALGELDDGADEYVIVGPEDGSDWLVPHLGSNQRLVPFRPSKPPLPDRVRAGLANRLANGRLNRASWAEPFFDSLGADVVHFPYQSFRRCSTRTIFNTATIRDSSRPTSYASVSRYIPPRVALHALSQQSRNGHDGTSSPNSRSSRRR